jgi:hypothetical protein
MRNSFAIDPRHSRAIVREIGERLRSALKEDRELPENLECKSNASANQKTRHQAVVDPDQSRAIAMG